MIKESVKCADKLQLPENLHSYFLSGGLNSKIVRPLLPLFTDSAVKNPEYGINLNQHTMKEFMENYAFEKMIEEM